MVDFAANAAHDAHHIDLLLVLGERHEVGKRCNALVGLERGFEHGRVRQVTTGCT